MDSIRATPMQYPTIGLLSDKLKELEDYVKRSYAEYGVDAGTALNLLGIPAVQQTAERIAYGEPLTTGKGMTTQVRPEVMEAAMTLLPAVGTTAKGAEKAAMAAGRAGERYAEKVVPQIMERGGMPASLLGDLSTQTVSPLTVYQGSPHKFAPTAKNPLGEFDPTKIGTGEGAQAFGYGHYTAEAKKLGEYYRDILSQDIANPAKKTLEKFGGDVDAAIQASKAEAQRLSALDLTPETGAAKRDQLLADQLSKIDELTKYKYTGEFTSGYLYEIDLPDEQIAKMLDWDKPLNRQSDAVKKALEPLIPEIRNAAGGGYIGDLLGKGIYELMGSGIASPETARKLREVGIPGIRYLDQGSRGVGEGTSNFVVFPGGEDLLTILKRNNEPVGLLAPQQRKFETSVSDASEIFGQGAKRIKYTDPNSGGMIDVLQRPDGTASVLGLEVPEAMRGQGIGQALQSQVMQDFPEMMGQVSSKAAAKTAYRLGRRPPNQPDATLEDVYKIMDEYSSVNLVSPDMQKRMMRSLLD
jgi:predicted GNAT family acetyltransferase